MTARSNGRTAAMIETTETTPEALAAPAAERLAAGDLAYNRRICAERRDAEARLAMATAAMQSWWRYLQETYGLAEADVVDAEGAIARAPREG